jgi:hypothetical protein
VERIKQRLESKKFAELDWNPSGNVRNATLWDQVKSLMAKHPKMSTDQIAKLADGGMATVYRIKRE